MNICGRRNGVLSIATTIESAPRMVDLEVLSPIVRPRTAPARTIDTAAIPAKACRPTGPNALSTAKKVNCASHE
jgi:hypothetical protein